MIGYVHFMNEHHPSRLIFRSHSECYRHTSRIAPWCLFFLPFFIFFLFDLASPVLAHAALADLLSIPSPVPEKELKMKGGSLPSWKKLWDEGRDQIRAGDLAGARSKYEELLKTRKKLEEARWEYSWLLISLGDWENAVKNLEILSELFPGENTYLNALAISLRGQGHYTRALDLFRKNYSRDPDDLLALCGMAQGLVEGGRKKEAYPLLRKIFDHKPSDKVVKLALANLAFEIGKLETARKLLVQLAAENNVGLNTLLMTARVHERLDRHRLAVKYWQRILQLDSGNREARGRLAIYYENRGQFDKALDHLLSLLEKNPNNLSLLGKICNIYVNADRFAEALPYFERYVQIRPDDLDALRSIININIALGNDTVSLYRRILAITPDDPEILNHLASDLLAAGELEGALFMWRYISRLVPERPEVFYAIADLLARLGRVDEQIDVLQSLHELAPSDMQVLLKLAQLKHNAGDLSSSLEYYEKLQKTGYLGWALFEGRGQLYEELKRPIEALADYEKLLSLSPTRNDIRRRCITLAGAIGDPGSLKRLTEQHGDVLFTIRMEDLLLAAGAYRKARDFGKAYSIYTEILGSFKDNEWQNGSGYLQVGEYEQALYGLSGLLEEEGLIHDGEQILREYYIDSGKPEVLLKLFDLALSRKALDPEKAQVWFSQFSAQAGKESGQIKLMKARLLASTEELSSAEAVSQQILQESLGRMIKSDGDDREVVRMAGVLLADIYIEDGELADAERHCLAMLGNEPDMEVLVQLLRVYHIAEAHEAAGNIFELLVSSSGGVLALMDLAELLGKHDLPGYQAVAAERALDLAPYSSRAGNLAASAMLSAGRSEDASVLLRKLQKRYPANVSLTALLARAHFQSAQNDLVVEQCDEVLERYPGRMDMEYLKARGVLAGGDEERVLKSIATLFPERVEFLLANDLRKAGLEVSVPKKKRTLWQVMTFSSANEPGLVELLMSASALVDSAAEQNRERNSVAVKFFARWQWEKAFLSLVSGS